MKNNKKSIHPLVRDNDSRISLPAKSASFTADDTILALEMKSIIAFFIQFFPLIAIVMLIRSRLIIGTMILLWPMFAFTSIRAVVR
jgi:fatty acid desaturase